MVVLLNNSIDSNLTPNLYLQIIGRSHDKIKINLPNQLEGQKEGTLIFLRCRLELYRR